MIKRFVCYVVFVIRGKKYQSQSGKIGGEVFKEANGSVNGIRCFWTKFKGGVVY